MITFLWMLYLTALLYNTIATVRDQIRHFKKVQSDNGEWASQVILWASCLGWAIWYMYYLN